ncbi:Thiol-disulfide oxidoreductase ResA [Pontiella desulfatans]|uniref:Thiol-disulfide oxidoreductase ResA n=1 Tax=Pontiella desulfatans TaxID=2750659 RepID=A0A6C2U659_PONDE|nr:thioredoxin family protein [Pontiella desulfatans]VGO15562.1 Thiol-disulfide oxidoreductase ResA [Pontiella desulfatans]
MKIAHCLIVVATTCLLAQAEMRTWTSTAGTTLEAEFVKLKYDTVYLRTADGEEKRIPRSKLIMEDQQLAQTLSNPFAKDAEDVKDVPKAPDAIYALFGDELRDADKKKVSVDALAGKTIGIYFSAHWCPPCRAFTPELVKFHKKMQQKDKPFEIVFVSSDREKAAMYEYMEDMDMPWLALPFGDDHKGALSSKYGVRGIPMLVIINKDGELITKNGRGDVSSKGDDAYDSWK